jgi:hypothetical protein
MVKIIIVSTYGGFGNKIFNLIIGLFLQHLNGGKLYTFDNLSNHDKSTDPELYEIFPKLKKYYTFITKNYAVKINKYKKYTEHFFSCNDLKSIDDFYLKNGKDVIYLLTTLHVCYRYIYDIFLHSNKIKNIFKINNNLISKNILNLSNEKYIVIHIRYGDKLNFIVNDSKKFVFLIYTPEYYCDIINKLAIFGYNIYIISDDNFIVEKFILNKIKNKKVTLLDSNWIDSFFLLSNSTYNVLSISTFSFLASLINTKLINAYIVKRPSNLNKFFIHEENIINNTNWFISDNKKYILNYDKKLAFDMYNSRIEHVQCINNKSNKINNSFNIRCLSILFMILIIIIYKHHNKWFVKK